LLAFLNVSEYKVTGRMVEDTESRLYGHKTKSHETSSLKETTGKEWNKRHLFCDRVIEKLFPLSKVNTSASAFLFIHLFVRLNQ